MQKKIRDIERLIRKKGETDELLAKLTELKSEKKANEVSLLEKKHAEKYHMVKFFERKKLVRKIISLDSKIAADDSKKVQAKLTAEREKLVDDLCYVLYYPKSMKYIAIFANNNEDDNELATPDTRSEQARTLARAAREEDQAAGVQDKVNYAIEVGQGLHKTSSSGDGSELAEDNENSSPDSDQDGDDEKSTKKRKNTVLAPKNDFAPNKKEKSIKSVDSQVVVHASVKKARVVDDEQAFAGSEEPVAKKQKKEKSRQKEKESISKSSTTEIVDAATAGADDVVDDEVDAAATGDSFFLEEAPYADNNGRSA